MTSLERLNAIRASAGAFPAKRRDVDLYAVLGDCLTFCEEIDRDGADADLRLALSGHDIPGKKRRSYVETGSDIYLMVGRFVFDPNRAAAFRYGVALREAALKQVKGADLPGWLKDHGGIASLFLRRPLTARTVTTKTLHLNQAVTVPKEGTITLTLRRDHRNFFDVVDVEKWIEDQP